MDIFKWVVIVGCCLLMLTFVLGCPRWFVRLVRLITGLSPKDLPDAPRFRDQLWCKIHGHLLGPNRSMCAVCGDYGFDHAPDFPEVR